MTAITITELLAEYRSGRLGVRDHLQATMKTIRGDDEHRAWITVLDDAQLAPYLSRLEATDPDELPLYGVPFAIKDNIDLADVPTTAGCPDYAYTPDRSAFVVQRLVDAGAVPVGKTNLDQFATGLVGTRSPFGVCRNAFDPDHLSGGSSSGSAVAVALGQVAFSLGTDTAGSGRVPAMFNNLVGVKPTRGLLSASGVVPACRTLDTVSIFALTGPDARRVLDAATAFDPGDAFARPDRVPELGHGAIPATGFRFGVPKREQLAFFGDEENPGLFEAAIDRLVELGGTAVEIDFAPFLEAARLLYEGPWVAERYAAIEGFIEQSADSLHPVTRQIIEGGAHPRAVEAFKAQYRLAELRRQTEAVWDDVDLVVTPTAGRHYRIDEVEADPVQKNSDLGYYTNFMNLLDFAALAVPAGFRDDGLPFGVTLFSPAFTDRDLLVLGDRLQRESVDRCGATGHPLPDESIDAGGEHVVPVAVCGAHLDGLPLNWQLTQRRARLAQTTRTAPVYRFYALQDGPPERPGLVRVAQGGAAIDVEVWDVPASEFGSFVAGIPAPLAIGKLALADGRQVPGFVCESIASQDAIDITELGSWRAFLARQF